MFSIVNQTYNVKYCIMKSSMKWAALILCVLITTAGCESSAEKEAKIRAKIEAEQDAEAKPERDNLLRMEEQKRTEQERTMKRFSGRYTFIGGEDVSGIEVSSDGTVFQVSHIFATGEETKKYIGEISVISDHAFVPNCNVFVSEKTPLYVIRNGSEHECATVAFPGKRWEFIFDVNEGRAYRSSIGAYNNRHVSEVEYVKFRH